MAAGSVSARGAGRGQGVDSLIFYPLAFYGIWTNDALIAVVIFNFTMKVTVEVLFTPLTYLVVNGLKRAEGVDTFDFDTDFTPFSLADSGVRRKIGGD